MSNMASTVLPLNGCWPATASNSDSARFHRSTFGPDAPANRISLNNLRSARASGPGPPSIAWMDTETALNHSGDWVRRRPNPLREEALAGHAIDQATGACDRDRVWVPPTTTIPRVRQQVRVPRKLAGDCLYHFDDTHSQLHTESSATSLLE